MNEMSELLLSSQPEQQLSGVMYFRKLLATGLFPLHLYLLFLFTFTLDKSPPIDDVISLGFIPRAMQLFSEGNAQIQFELSWIFTNLACGTTPQVQILVENGAIPSLMSLLIHPRDEVRYTYLPLSVSSSLPLTSSPREQSIWALANISGHTEVSRNPLLSSKILDYCLDSLSIDLSQQQSLSAYHVQYDSPWPNGHRRAFPTPSLFLMQHFSNLFSNLVRYIPLSLLILFPPPSPERNLCQLLSIFTKSL
jgi:hypothetical protein